MNFIRALPVRRHQHACAFLLDWADDISYSTHDVEDFYRAGLIPLGRLTTDDEELKRFFKSQYTDANSENEAAGDFWTIKKFLPRALQVPFDGSFEQRGALRFFISQLVGNCVKAVNFSDTEGKHPGLKIDKFWIRKVWSLVNQAITFFCCLSNRSSLRTCQSLKANTNGMMILAIGTNIKSPRAQLYPAFEKSMHQIITDSIVPISTINRTMIIGIVKVAALATS